MAHTLTLKQIEPVTHNTYRLVFARPQSFEFTPGQATDMSLDREGWRDEYRPFTMTSQPEDEDLEYVIKTYPEHEGVTNEIATLTPGENVFVGQPWGAIRDIGPGTFIAGGAGVTPFIPILRRRDRDGTLAASHLVFGNKSEDDIILRPLGDVLVILPAPAMADEDIELLCQRAAARTTQVVTALV